MKRSDKRILTTHVGSLIRPPELIRIPARQAQSRAYDEDAYQRCLADSVAEIVRRASRRSASTSISDGEFGKSISWSQYVLERLSGFERGRCTLGARSLCLRRRPPALPRIL